MAIKTERERERAREREREREKFTLQVHTAHISNKEAKFSVPSFVCL